MELQFKKHCKFRIRWTVKTLLFYLGNFPPPTTPEEVGARMLAQERVVEKPSQGTTEMEVESDEDLSDSDHEEEQRKTRQPPPPPPPSGRPPPPDDIQVQVGHHYQSDHHLQMIHKYR